MNVNSLAMPLDDTLRQQQFVELLQAHRGLLRKIAWSFSRCDADRADLMQDMTVQLWTAFAQWDGERPFSTWAYRVALNVALSGRRRARSDSGAALASESWDDDTHDTRSAGTDSCPEHGAQLRELQRVVASLDPLNRALLLLWLDDVAYREIGEILGLSETNVGVRLNRLKQKLRTQLETTP